MNPTVEQLNARNRAVGAPVTPTGAYTPTLNANFTSPSTNVSYNTPIVTSKPATDHITSMGETIDKANKDIANASQYRTQQEADKLAEEKLQKEQAINTAKDPLTAIMGALGEDTTQSDIITSNKNANELDKSYLKEVSDAIDQMNAGTYPLSSGEKASVDNLKFSFGSALSDAENLMKNRVGGQTVLNARGGFQMYSPQEAINRIATRVKEGNAKIAEINSNLIEAQNKLTQAFKDQDFKTATSLYNKISDTIKARNDEINDINKSVADSRKELLDAMKEERTRQDKIQEEITKNKNSILLSLGKSMTPVPSEVVQAVQDAPDVASAVAAAGQYLQDTPTSGIVGEYMFYKKQAEQAGQTPVSFNEYQNIDANRKAKATAASAGGLSPTVLTKVQSIAGNFDNEQSVKSYQTVAEGKSFLDSIPDDTKNPSDQQGVIYAFAKIMDPNSVVREGEYNTVQKYAQSWASTFGFNAARIFSNSPFLSEEAIKNMKATIASKVKASENSYNNIYNEYGRRIDKLTGSKDGKDYLTDYSKGYSTANDLLQSGAEAKAKVDEYIKSNPQEADRIAKLYETPSAAFGGRTPTDEEIVEYLNLK